MAQEDLDDYKQGHSRGGWFEGKRDAKTADEILDWHGPLISDVANEEAAAAAGVKDAAFINYAEALEAYESRSDIEDLAHRRARDFPVDFDDASFMRETGDVTGSGVTGS